MGTMVTMEPRLKAAPSTMPVIEIAGLSKSFMGHGAADYVPVTLLVTAAIFALAAAPTFLGSRDWIIGRYRDGDCRMAAGDVRALPEE